MSDKTKHRRRNRQDQAKAKRLAKAITLAAAAPPVPGNWKKVTSTLMTISFCLNELEKAGVTPQLAHGAVITDAGYVFAIGDGNYSARWQVRTRQLAELPADAFTFTDEDD